jgi:hypothetical protein
MNRVEFTDGFCSRSAKSINLGFNSLLTLNLINKIIYLLIN